jgi:hypothetical protein
MTTHSIKDRLDAAMHRGGRATEAELEYVAAVVLVVVGELTAELAALIVELRDRVEVLEGKAS